jgi:aminopeptidase N
VVYRKGAYVLHMLRQLMYDSKLGDKPFIDMMHDFVAHHTNGNASTESFQRVVEQHMSPLMDVAGNRKMDWFFSEWVYGTAVPRYKFDYTVTPAEDGKWLMKGRLTQSDVPANFVMQVPIYLDFGGQVVQLGRVKMAGNTTVDNLNVTLPKQPKRVLINYWHDVLEQ